MGATLQNGYGDGDGGAVVAVGRARDSNPVSALPTAATIIYSDGIPNAWRFFCTYHFPCHRRIFLALILCASLVFLKAYEVVYPCRLDPRAPTPSITFSTDTDHIYNNTQQTSLRKCEHMLHIAFNVIIYAFASCSVCDALIVFIGHVG